MKELSIIPFLHTSPNNLCFMWQVERERRRISPYFQENVFGIRMYLIETFPKRSPLSSMGKLENKHGSHSGSIPNIILKPFLVTSQLSVFVTLVLPLSLGFCSSIASQCVHSFTYLLKMIHSITKSCEITASGPRGGEYSLTCTPTHTQKSPT